MAKFFYLNFWHGSELSRRDIVYLFEDQGVEEGTALDGTGVGISLRHGALEFEPYRGGPHESYRKNDVYHL